MIEQHCVAASSMKVMDLMNFLKRSLGREPSSWARRCKPSDPWLHHIAWPRGPGLYPFQALLKPFSVIGKAACLECSGCEEIWDLSVKFALQESLVWYVRTFGVWARRERNWSNLYRNFAEKWQRIGVYGWPTPTEFRFVYNIFNLLRKNFFIGFIS